MSIMTPRWPPRLRAYAHVLQARWRRGRTEPPLPHATHLLVTWRCNLRCSGCDAWQRKPETELTVEQWTRVFAQLRSLDIIKIIGGEPFARDDLAEIIKALRREINPFVVQLVTNATATERIVRFAETDAWPGLHLRISLDGLGDTHDRSRGMEGTFERVMETMHALAKVRKKRRFQVAVNFTVTDESLPDMDPLIALCKPLKIDVVPGFKVKPFLKHCDIRREKARTIGLTRGEEAIERLQRPDHGARTGFTPLERLSLQAINRRVFRKHTEGGASLKFRCRELAYLMYMNPYGDLITCGLNQEPIGNILRDGFENLWRSSKAVEARRQVSSCPGCMQGAVEIMSRLYGK